ncbi:hypothetical protein H5410_044408 [Solanum commersonii]|uniref:Uncharacterized protein n=1 Tax=Solanum commersonii TaxID=4109 RepID=A0A9J5X9M2_SOLCO|nr:hypothetical protein H5410_044408 [Solanum commersonii]
MARDARTLSEEALDTEQDTSMIDSRAKSLYAFALESAAHTMGNKVPNRRQYLGGKNLLYAIVGKFSNGWMEIQELCKIIPTQCERAYYLKAKDGFCQLCPHSGILGLIRKKKLPLLLHGVPFTILPPKFFCKGILANLLHQLGSHYMLKWQQRTKQGQFMRG